MSLGSIKGGQPAVLDLLAVATKPNEPRLEVPRADAAGDTSSSRFDEVLNASQTRERRAAEGRDESGRSLDRSDETVPIDRQTDSDAASSTTESKQSDSSDAQASREDASVQDAGTESSTEQAENAGDTDEASVSQSASGDAQTQAAQSAVAQAVLSAPTVAEQAAQSVQQGESKNGPTAEQQAQAAALKAAGETAERQQAKATAATTTGPVVAGVTPAQQQAAQGETGADQQRGESSASAKQVAPTGQAQANTAATGTAFTLPANATSEAQLPLQPTTATQSADASKVLQTQAQGAPSDGESLNTARLQRGMANAVQQRGGAVTLRLTPPEMGTVRIQMQLSGGNVSASFHAETASAQTLLTQQLGQLRTALETQGMNVERLSVQPLASSSQSQNANNNANDNQQQNQGQQQSANDGRSRGQYGGSSDGRSSGDGRGDDGASQQQQARRGFFDRLTDAAEPTAASN